MPSNEQRPAPPAPRVEQGSRYDPNFGRTSAQEFWKNKMPKKEDKAKDKPGRRDR
jgi:hypothetical protein